MSTLAVASSTAVALPARASDTPVPPTDSRDLLPSPAVDAQTDDLSMLFALQVRSRGANRRAKLDDVGRIHAERKRLQAQMREALRKAAKARHKKKGWGKVLKVLGTVARVAAVVGSIAAVVATWGAATPVAALAISGAALSTAGFVMGETKILEQFPNGDKWALGVSLAGAALTCGAGFAASATGAISEMGAVQKSVAIAGCVAESTGGAARAGTAVASIPVTNLQRREDNLELDADDLELDAGHQQWLIEQTIEMLDRMEESDGQTMDALAEAIEAKTDTIFQLGAGQQWKA